jgi:hypothetical protein
MTSTEKKALAVAAVLVLCASLGLLAASGDDNARNEPAAATGKATEPSAAPGAGTEPLRLDLLNRTGHSGPRRDAFMTPAKPPAPPQPVAAPAPVEPPPPPSAPALPFTFMGQFETPGEKTVYYLVEGDKLYAVTEGETINGTHRIEAVQGNQMSILYLPLSITQTLPVGATP